MNKDAKTHVVSAIKRIEEAIYFLDGALNILDDEDTEYERIQIEKAYIYANAARDLTGAIIKPGED